MSGLKKISKSKAKARAWKAFSLYIRLRDAKGENVTCVTCLRVNHYKKMQAGHFIPGRHNAVLFEERGVHPQCYACNIVLGGNGVKYYKFMLAKYGQKIIDELEALDNTTVSYTVSDLLEIETVYLKKIGFLTNN